MSKQDEVGALQITIKEKLKNLPVNEFTYYLTLLLATIQEDKDEEEELRILQTMLELISNVERFYTHPEEMNENLNKVTQSVDELTKISSFNTSSYKTQRALLGIWGGMAAIVFGTLFAIVGFSAGLLSNYNIIGNIEGAGLGFVSGFAVGLLAGYRSPIKLCENPIRTQLEFCIKNITRLENELKDRETQDEYKQKTKEYILNTFFANVPEDEKEERFKRFLEEEQTFQICSTTAGHISRKLKGYLGHHALIRYSINGVTSIPIEFGDRKRTPNYVDQQEEPRTVSGEVLFNMLALDCMLQDTHTRSGANAMRIYNIGSDDCRTYVDKILVGTGQEPTSIERFTDNDKPIARALVRPVISFFSYTSADALAPFREHPQEVTLNTYEGHKP